jgi:hypothetical protein
MLGKVQELGRLRYLRPRSPQLLPTRGTGDHQGRHGQQYGGNEKDPKSGHPAKTGSCACAQGLFCATVIEVNSHKSHSAQKDREQRSSHERQGQKTDHRACGYQQADHDRTRIPERDTSKGPRFFRCLRLEGCLGRSRGLLQLIKAGYILFELRLSALMAEASALDQQSAAGTAWFHTSSLKRVTRYGLPADLK